MKTYVTFGHGHAHAISGKTFDRNCVAVINCENEKEGRKLAFKYFGPKFCMEYHEERFDHKDMHYFPRGLISVNF